MLEFIDKGKSQFILFESLLNLTNVANKMQCSAKCNSGCIALQWIHNKHHLDDQYTKFQAYTFRVPKKCFLHVMLFSSSTILQGWNVFLLKQSM